MGAMAKFAHDESFATARIQRSTGGQAPTVATATAATVTTGAGARTDTIVGWYAQAWQHTGTRTTSNKTGDQELDG